MFVEFLGLRSAPCVLYVLSYLPQLFSILLIRLTWFQYHSPPLYAALKLHVFHAGFFCYAPLVSMPCTPRVKPMDASSVTWVWVFAICMLGISMLGTHAARTENKSCLKVFAGFMGIGMIIMLIFGIAVAVLKNPTIEKFQSDEFANEIMKNGHTKELLEILQQHLQCCGWTGVEDWGTSIPDSCRCPLSYGKLETAECKSRPEGFTGPSDIYSKSCSHALMYYVELGFKISLGIFFGFFVIAVIGLIIAINMIHQISHHSSIGQTAFALKAY
ncbi:23 kDa integral membrane protein-like isoform X2 [Girardinichthys multiradiatus]|uniref:23 kDa integral membrane protein-like isoform X2 n=1 Tax=Girardinichthys multiradiatus TaxID=208333 RepID=UPI001FAB9DD0|nr:23 kDa integral membrane protein-like isoform X2 [Girardinichthys multiradiatus]